MIRKRAILPADQATPDAAKVRKLQIAAKQRVLDLFYGAYRSAFKGKGIEVKEIREYVAGDDVRAISWTRTAKMGRPYVKTFREERDLVVTLVVDISASLDFGGRSSTYREQMAAIGALLALSSIYNHDKVSLLLFTDKVEKYIPPKRGERHGSRLIRELLSYAPQGSRTDIEAALHFLHGVQKKRTIVFLLSDFLAEGWERAFSITAERDDLIAIRMSPKEAKLPLSGLVRVQDLETKEMLLVDMSCVREEDLIEARKRRDAAFKALIGKSGAGCIDLTEEASYERALLAFFRKRKRELIR